jgi:hypothetical protein
VYRTHRYYFFRLKARRAEAQAQQSRELALAEPTPLSEV